MSLSDEKVFRRKSLLCGEVVVFGRQGDSRHPQSEWTVVTTPSAAGREQGQGQEQAPVQAAAHPLERFSAPVKGRTVCRKYLETPTWAR